MAAPERDWTRVQSEACRECGLDAGAVAEGDLAGAIEDEGRRWCTWLTAASEDPALRRRPAPEVWSALEYAGHVRDVFHVFTARLARALDEDEPDVGWWDHEAAVEGYGDDEAGTVAGALVANARTFAAALRAVPALGWGRRLLRRGREGFTVAGLGRFALHESAHHRRDAARSLVLRTATAEDAQALAEVFLASRAALGFLPVLHTDDQTRRFVADVVETDEVVLAESGGEPVGLLALDGDEVDHLYVHPDQQGRGLGTALLDEATRRRPDGLELWCFEANHGARRFYEHHGFAVVARTDGDNEEGLADLRYRLDRTTW